MDGIFLKAGAHDTLEQGGCVMEFSAWVAGEPHSDHPQCVDEAIAAFCRRVNDRLPDDLRQQLIPVAIDAVGTRTGDTDRSTRRWLMADWACRVTAPWWFREAKMEEWALRLEAMPEVTKATAPEVRKVVQEARSAAYAAAAISNSSYADADAKRRKFWEANLDSCLALIAAAISNSSYADADAKRRKFWEANLDSCLALIHKCCAVGRKAEVELIPERVAVCR